MTAETGWSLRSPKLTEEQKEQQNIVVTILQKMRILLQKHREVKTHCKHVVQQLPCSHDVDNRRASCYICYTDLGRKCYYSLDNVCHFDVTMKDGNPVIELIDGTLYHCESRFTETISSHRCLFCNEPKGGD